MFLLTTYARPHLSCTTSKTTFRNMDVVLLWPKTPELQSGEGRRKCCANSLNRAALIAKRLRLEFALIFGEQTKFAETLSEERLGVDESQGVKIIHIHMYVCSHT